MKIAIEGCAHGELEKIYDTIAFLEQKDGVKVDLLICCGDFQVGISIYLHLLFSVDLLSDHSF